MNATMDITPVIRMTEPEYAEGNFSQQLLVKTDSRYLKDMRINLQNTLSSAHLLPKEATLIALAVAINGKNEKLVREFSAMASVQGVSEEELAETMACASLLSANNVLYRFRHFMQKEKYDQLPARIKMSIMMNPVMGKELFELISLAVSAVNGCEKCVNAHEHSLVEMGTSEERIFETVRLAAVIISLDKLV